MKCPDCGKEIVRIERYQPTVVWKKNGDQWEMSIWNQEPDFHLYCQDYDKYSNSGKHKCKCWVNELPDDLFDVVWGRKNPSKKG